MDENNEVQECQNNEEVKVEKSGIKVWQILLIFFGILFLESIAVFTVVEKFVKNLFSHSDVSIVEKLMNKEMMDMDKRIEDEQRLMFTYPSSTVINMKENEKEYKIIIDLKYFNNDKDNITVNVEDSTLNINAQYVKQTKNNKSVSELHQSYVFDSNSELNNLTEEVVGNKYVITIPKGEVTD